MQASSIPRRDLETPQLRELNIHTSDRMSFKRCRRVWNWTSPLRGYLQSKTRRAPLWFGTGWHFVMEDFHGYRQYSSPVDAWRDYCRATFEVYGESYMPDYWRDLRTLGEGMARYYTLWLQGRDELKTYYVDGVPQVEVNFKIPLPVSAELLERLGIDVVYYNGTLDRVIETNFGLLAIGEYKTAKAIYKAHYLTDPQVTAYCVPLDTEILTRKGWLKYDQLVIGQEVMGYNADSDCLEWTKLEDISTFANESVNRISNKSFDFVATPEHRWVRHVQHKGMSYKNNPKTSLHIDTLNGYENNSYLVLSAPFKPAGSSITPDEAAVVAWLLTDGTFGEYDSGLRASISQSNKKYAKEVQELLDRVQGYTRVVEKNDCKTWHLSMQYFRSLWNKAGLTPELLGWEQFILGLSPEARQAFCNAGMQAEGSENKQFYQNKGIKQDIFRLAFFLSGIFPSKGWSSGKGAGYANQGICEAFTLTTRHKWMRPIKIESAGICDVWCPKTALGTWIMRQGSQIAITGNSWGANCIYDRTVDGCYYYQFKKSIPDEPHILAKTGRPSCDKSKMVTTHRYYRDVLIRMYGIQDGVIPAPKENIDHLNYLAGAESESGDGFIQRDYIMRNDHSLQVEGLKIMMELEDMLNPDLPLYPNPTRECVMFPCDFHEACVSLDDGSDWEQIIQDEFESRGEERRDPWRNHLLLPNPYKELVLQQPPQSLVQQLALQRDQQ